MATKETRYAPIVTSQPVHHAVKVEAAKEGRVLVDVVTEALTDWLRVRGVQVNELETKTKATKAE